MTDPSDAVWAGHPIDGTIGTQVTGGSIVVTNGTVTGSVSVSGGTMVANGTTVVSGTPTVSIPGEVEIIDYAHERIHDGQSWTANFSNAVTNTNELTGMVWYYGSTANKQMHVTFQAQAAKNTTVNLYKSPVVLLDSNSGTASAVSRNQASPGTATVKTASATPTVGVSTYNEGSAAAGTITSATILDTYYLAGGEGPRSFGSQNSRDSQEWIFGGTVATLYSFVMKAGTDDDDTHYMRMDWYETDA